MRRLTRTEKCTLFASCGLLKAEANTRYYEGGVSSVYLWDLDDGGFAGVVLFKKGTITVIDDLAQYLSCSNDSGNPQRTLRYLGLNSRL